MYSIDDVIKNKINGLYFGNRIILPFKAHFLKVIIEDDIITDFGTSASGIFIREKEDFTDVYFLDFKNLKSVVSKYEAIKFLVVEKGKNVFDKKNMQTIAVYLGENHEITIEETDSNILFIK